MLSIPGVTQPHAIAEAEVYLVGTYEGGRHTPFGTGNEPQFFFGPTAVTGKVEVLDSPGGDALVRPAIAPTCASACNA